MLQLVHIYIKKRHALMRTTITIDDTLYKQALEISDPGMNRSDLFREAIETFVRVQAAKRLAALGSTMPDMQDIPRHLETTTISWLN